MDKNRRLGLTTIVLTWMVVFMLPLGLIDRSHASDTQSLIVMTAVFVSLLGIFCINCYWLTPKKLMRGRQWEYFLLNAVFIIAFAVITHLIRRNQPIVTSVWHGRISLPKFLLMRDIFNMVVSATVSTAIVLSRNWARMTEKRQQAEIEKAAMELKLIRHEMHPHFLLNTLNNIYSLTAIDTPKAQDAIIKLANLLHYMLYDSKKPTIALQQEVDFIKSYIDLMLLRLNKNVKVTQDIDISQAKDRRIVPLIFISTIENAFKHGVSPTEDSFISISIFADENEVRCTTENSYFPKNEKDQSGHGIGKKQTKDMLALSYPEKHRMECELSEDHKTYTTKIIIYDT